MAIPTLRSAEGFEERANTVTTGPMEEVAQLLSNPTKLTFVSGRLGGIALDVAEDGATATAFNQDIASAPTILVWSGYFKLPGGAPSVDRSQILRLAAGATALASITVRTSANGSVLELQPGTGTRQTGPDCTDGAWHQLELKVNVSANPWRIDWRVDGTGYTQATTAVAASTVSRIVWGSLAAAHTAHVQWDDCVWSATSGDYPISQFVGASQDWAVRMYNPTGDGTHVPGTNDVVDAGGGATNLYQAIDDWLAGAADTSTYLTYQSTTLGDAATRYAEMTFADLETDVADIWAVVGETACFAGSTTADNITVRLVDASGTTITNIFTGDPSQTTLIFSHTLSGVPAGGWMTDFNGVKVRVGFSSDTSPLPRCSAVGLSAAVLIDVTQNADVSLSTVAGVAALTGNTVAADANNTLSVVAGVAAVGAPTVTGDANIAQSMVAAIAAVPAPTVEATSPDADVTLITVAAVASVGTLTVAADANITLVTVAAIAAVGTPTVTADASITLTPVAALAAAPAPTIEANANAPPDTVAAIAAVPTPTVTADASVSLSTVAATAAIPTPTVAATADVTLSTVAAIAAVGAPTVTADADISLGSVPAVASIPAPTVAGDANVDLTTVEALVAIETPLVETGVNADVDLVTVEAIADVPAPIVAADADVTLGVVVAIAAVPSPSVSATSTFFAVALVVGGGEISATGYRYRAIIPETHIVGEWSENRSLEGANMPGKSW